MSRARSVGPACLALGALLAGCSGAIYSRTDFRTGQPPRENPPAGGQPAADVGGSGAPRDKASVLAKLGPPGEVLPLAEGDLFVYRRRRIDGSVLNINSSIFTGIAVPIYASVVGRQHDDVLLVQFDAAGRVVAVSESLP